MRQKNEGNNRGGEGKDDTCDHGLHVQKLESRSVPKKIYVSLEEIINQQSAAIRSTSSTKQHELFVSYVPTHDRLHLVGKRPQQRSQGPQQQSKPSYRLLATTFEWRSLTTGTCIIQPSRPRGRSHSQCCCVAFPGAVIVINTTSFSFSHACACHVYSCIYVRVPTEIQYTNAPL